MSASLNIRKPVDVPCYYCDGEGGGYERTDVDAWDRPVVCDECGGSGISSRKAGDRNTGPYPLVYSFGGRAFVGDPLVIMANSRRNMTAARLASAWDRGSRVAEYEYFRLIAMRPSSRSRLREADMLALASRCLNRVSEMRNFA